MTSQMQFRMNRVCLWAAVAWCVCVVASASERQASELNNAGVEAYQQGRYGEAISLLEQALGYAPNSDVVRRNLCNACQSQANALAAQRDFRGAVQYIEAAIRVDPMNASPYTQMGSYYLAMDDVAAAIQRLEQAIQLKPGDPDAHELLGEAYYRDNDLSSARVQWEYVLEVDPGRRTLAEKYEKAFREESVEFDFNRWKSRHFSITYPPEVPHATRAAVSSILDRAYLDIGRTLGGVHPPPPIHVILYSAEQFSEATQLAGHVGAVYDGKIRSPLTDAQGNWLTEEELRRRLVHEYVHVVVRHLAGPAAPWWLNEGLAEALSKTLSADDIARLRARYAEGLSYPLARLESNQVNQMNPDQLRYAYLQSHATVDLLWNRFGRQKLVNLLRELATGASSETAFQYVYRRNYATLEADVAAMYR